MGGCDQCNDGDGDFRCSGCNLTYYCSKECGREAWNEGHYLVCKLHKQYKKYGDDVDKHMFAMGGKQAFQWMEDPLNEFLRVLALKDDRQMFNMVIDTQSVFNLMHYMHCKKGEECPIVGCPNSAFRIVREIKETRNTNFTRQMVGLLIAVYETNKEKGKILPDAKYIKLMETIQDL